MARKRDPKQLLERAQQMEAEARRIRREADRIRREREAKEDRKAGALLRRFWKNGWAKVDLGDVATAAGEVFGESPERQTATPPSGDLEGTSGPERSRTEGETGDRPTEANAGLFETGAERTGGGT